MYQSNSTHQLWKHTRTGQVVRLPRRGEGFVWFENCVVTLADLLDSGWEAVAKSEYLGHESA